MSNAPTNCNEVTRSATPSVGNPTNKEDRLAQILDEYLVSLEEGLPLDLDQLATTHSDLADEIRSFASSLELLHHTTQEMRPAAQRSTEQKSKTKQLGDYRIGREIGRGGMGVVYEAQQLSLQRKVALKVLPFAAMWDQKQIARFRNEAMAAAQLHHPNIVPVFAVGEERGVHFYAMQLIEGQSLDQMVRQLRETKPQAMESTVAVHSTITEGQALSDLSTQHSQDRSGYCRAIAQLGKQAANALHHAHEYGVVHRDIKPSNLMIDGQAKVWVTDFGLARIQNSPGVTMSGDVVGTLRYMSPEQAAGQHTLVDTRTDIYGLGATLYELLTLRAAFPGEDRNAVLRDIEAKEPTAPRTINPTIPVDLETIVLQAMSKQRDSRYATAQALADDLGRFLEGKPTFARRPTVVDRTSKWMRRHRNMVALAASFLIMLTLGSTLAALKIASEQQRTAIALAEAKTNLQRAERHFAEARGVVDRFGIQLADRLQDTAGTEKIRQQLLFGTLDYYQKFASEIEGQVDIQDQLAMTHLKTGVVSAKLGYSEKAIAEYRTAQQLLNRLLEPKVGNTHLRSQLALSHNNMALLLAAEGKTQQALREYDLAIAQQNQLIVDDPEQVEFSIQLADSHLNLGTLLGESGASERAEKSLNQAVAILHANYQRDPQSINHARSLAMAYNNLAHLLRTTEVEKSLEYADQAVDVLERVCQTPQSTRDAVADLALCYGNRAAIQNLEKQTSEAIVSYQRAIELGESLVRTSPSIVRYRNELAANLNNAALLYIQTGQDKTATKAFGRANRLFAALLEDYPNQVAYASGWAALLNNQGLALANAKQFDTAINAYQQAAAAQEQVWRALPNSENVRESLGRIYYNCGQALRHAGRSEESVELALKRRSLWAEDGARLFAVAEELAQIAAADKVEKSNQLSEDMLRDEIVSTLAAALSAGYQPKVSLSTNERFRTWRKYPKFQELISEDRAAVANVVIPSPRVNP